MKSDKKIIVVGSDDIAYHFCFLSMTTLNLKEVYLYPHPIPQEDKTNDLQYASELFPMSKIKMGNEKDYADADVLILTAKENQLENEPDSEYLRRNILLVRKMINQAMASGFSGLIVVANKLDDLFTYLVWKFSGLPKNKIVGLGTYVDTVYFQKLLSEALDVSFNEVKGYIIGGSSPLQKTVAWSRSSMGGNSLLGLTMDPNTNFNQDDMSIIEEKIAKRNRMNENKELTLTTATALIELVQYILTNKKAIVSLVQLMDIGELKDIPLSIPVILGENGIRQIAGLNFSETEQKSLLISANEIRIQLDWVEQR